MKITVGIPSRGRPLDLAASILSLEKTRSGHHDVQYIVGHDHGDEETLEVVSRLLAKGLPIVSSFGPRPLGLGEINNRLADASAPDATFMLWSDRQVVVTLAWDHQIATGVMEFPNRVLWLDCVHLQGPAQYILPPAWRAALPGPTCPGLAPFWFDDTHIEEIDAMVFGFPRVAIAAKCAGPRTEKTTRCRDLKFWISLFAAMRRVRLEDAGRIAAKLGIVPRADLAEIVAYFEARDEAFLARADALMEQYGAPGEPDETYRKAKKRGEVTMMNLAMTDRTLLTRKADA